MFKLMENLIDFDYIPMPPVPSYYELEQIIIQQQRKMDEISIIIKKIQTELLEMRKNKMKRIEKLENKVIKMEDEMKDDIRLRNDMTIKVEVLEQLNNNLMVTFYYISLHDVTSHFKKFQRVTESKIFVHDVKHLQNGNELFLKKERYFNATIELNKDNDVDGLLDAEFMCIPIHDKLIIKKIEIPINSEKVDLSNKIILNVSEIQKFYNVEKLKICRLSCSTANGLIYIRPLKLKGHPVFVRFFRCSPNGKYLDKDSSWIVEN